MALGIFVLCNHHYVYLLKIYIILNWNIVPIKYLLPSPPSLLSLVTSGHYFLNQKTLKSAELVAHTY
jgi:hypothetical protein